MGRWEEGLSYVKGASEGWRLTGESGFLKAPTEHSNEGPTEVTQILEVRPWVMEKKSVITRSMLRALSGNIKARRGAVLGQAQITLWRFPCDFPHLHLLHGSQNPWRDSN